MECFHTAFIAMKYPAVCKELEREVKLEERCREIRKRATDFEELGKLRYIKAWGFIAELREDNFRE